MRKVLQCVEYNFESGGGIYIHGTSAIYTMEGTSTISFNYSLEYGAGISLENGAMFIMKDGTIRNNKLSTSSQGYGVSIGKKNGTDNIKKAFFTMSGSAKVDANNIVSVNDNKIKIESEHSPAGGTIK